MEVEQVDVFSFPRLLSLLLKPQGSWTDPAIRLILTQCQVDIARTTGHGQDHPETESVETIMTFGPTYGNRIVEMDDTTS